MQSLILTFDHSSDEELSYLYFACKYCEQLIYDESDVQSLEIMNDSLHDIFIRFDRRSNEGDRCVKCKLVDQTQPSQLFNLNDLVIHSSGFQEQLEVINALRSGRIVEYTLECMNRINREMREKIKGLVEAITKSEQHQVLKEYIFSNEKS